MKRILVYTTQMMETGGIESHVREFCFHMKSAGIEIDLIVLNAQMPQDMENLFKSICHRIFLCKNGRSYSRLLWLIHISRICRSFKYDAIYSNGQGNSIALLRLLLKRQTRWVHHHHMAGDKKDQMTWTAAYRSVLMKSSKVIACSKQNALEMQNALHRDIDTIPCFSRKIEGNNFPRDNGAAVRFGYYGRLIPEKGIATLCRLSDDQDFNKVEFHIWGEGIAYPASFFDQYPKLRYHGKFNSEDGLADVLRTIDAFLLLSVHPEGLPISLLEAMGFGLPWLATDKGGIPDIVCDPISTRVIPSTSSYTHMKNAVLSFAEDIAAGKISGEAQQELYAEKFSSSRLLWRWKEVLGIV
ncbi:glycosyltransferase family 4 protein [Pedobacter immunditicola]|uniref:glycosyltransferase family 4 protein n=1 Tax=Pedobacter immunditicola TaxID=3133440 RepID=UPI0030B4CE9D